MKLSLREKVAEKIDRACQYDNWSGSIFKEDDPECMQIQKYYLKIAEQIIKLVEKDFRGGM